MTQSQHNSNPEREYKASNKLILRGITSKTIVALRYIEVISQIEPIGTSLLNLKLTKYVSSPNSIGSLIKA